MVPFSNNPVSTTLPADLIPVEQADNSATSIFSDNKSLLNLLLSNTREYFLLIDRELKIRLYNEHTHHELKELMGVTIHPGSSVLDLTTPERRPYLIELYDDVFKGNPRETIIPLHLKNGDVRFIHNKFSPARDENGDVIAVMVISADITEKYKAEQDILNTEHRLNLLLTNMKEYFLMVDKNLNLILFNQTSADYSMEQFGITIKKGLNLKAFVPPDRYQALNDLYHAVFQGRTIDLETKLVDKAGAIRYYDSKISPAYDTDNNITAAIIISREVTEKKNTEESLRQMEERWRFAVEGSNLGVWDWDLTTNEMYFSTSYKKLYGFKENDIRNEYSEWAERVHPDDWYLIQEALANHFSNRDPYYVCTYRIKNKEGRYLWITARGMTVSHAPDGKPLRMIGTHADNTERITMAEGYKRLFESHPIPMFTYDPITLAVVEVNDAMVKLYGYTKEEFASLTLRDFRLEEDLPQLYASLEESWTGVHFSKTVRHVKKDGTTFYVEHTGNDIVQQDQKRRLVSIVDVTEKVNADRELKEINERFQLAAKASSDIIWDWNIESDEMLWSENYETLLGWKLPDNKIQSSMVCADRFHPDDKENVAKSLLQAVISTDQQFWSQELRYRRANGEYAYILDKGYIIRNEEGKAIRMIGAMQDITERYKKEEALRLSNERFLLASKATSDAIYDWDIESNKLEWAGGIHSLFGYYSYEVPIDIWETLIHEDDRENVMKSLNYALANEKRRHFREYYHFRKADGTYSYVLDRAFIVRDEKGKALRLIGAMQDVTEQKANEKMLIDSNDRFNAVLKATNDLIWDWDLLTGVFYRDPEGQRRVYGVENDEEISNIYSWMKHVHPDDHIHVQEVIGKILNATNEETFDLEYRFRTDDGTYNYVYDRGFIIKDASGRPVRMIGAAQNITDRKRLEQELLQRELERQKMITQATIETQEQERSEIGKELHDNVNQVLTTTKLYLDLAQSNAELKDDLINKSTKNIIYVINEIRQLSRSLMDPTLGDLGLLDSVKDLIEGINATRKLQVKLQASGELDEKIDSPEKLTIFRIIQEALNNAIKHSGATEAVVTLSLKHDNILLSVKDNGVGFSPKTVKKGAGLRNIQNRVYLANGSFSIKSNAGKGCNLKIILPVHHSENRT